MSGHAVRGARPQPKSVPSIAIACQGGGAHAAYGAGVLQTLLPRFDYEQSAFRLVGLSGASGGALCALLAWYGWVTRGPEAAVRLLGEFWQDNCARPGTAKAWLNRGLVNAIELSPWEIVPDATRAPQSLLHLWGDKLWPLQAEILDPHGDWASWLWRGDYFSLERLLARHVDFTLVDRLRDICSLGRDARRLQFLQLAGAGEAGPLQSMIHQKIERCRAEVARLREADWLVRLLAERGTDIDEWLLHLDLEVDADTGDPAALLKALARVPEDFPQLLVGAIDVDSGEFVAFSSHHDEAEGGLSRHAVLASCALPSLSLGYEIERRNSAGQSDSHLYWDGLLSQNPPIRDFLAGQDDAAKPDEIWIAQVNPQAAAGPERNASEAGAGGNGGRPWDFVSDRRNELAGNLSLNQEVLSIMTVNDWIMRTRRVAPGSSTVPGKLVQVLRIPLSTGKVEARLGRVLDTASKLDRCPSVKNALEEHGRCQAEVFTTARTVIMPLLREPHKLAGVPPAPDATGIELLRLLTEPQASLRLAGCQFELDEDEQTLELEWTLRLTYSPKPHTENRVTLTGALLVTVESGGAQASMCRVNLAEAAVNIQQPSAVRTDKVVETSVPAVGLPHAGIDEVSAAAPAKPPAARHRRPPGKAGRPRT